MSSREDREVGYDDFSFYLFAASVLVVIAVPTTIYKLVRLVKGSSKREEEKKLQKDWGCSECHLKAKNLAQKEKKWYNTWGRPSNVLLFLAWVTIALLFYKIVNSSEMATPFDPFEILEISSSATEKEIKAAFRRLSLIYHPDKYGSDDKFVKLTKAYEALTDEAARENYEKYGNPDGYQGTKFGIGLPTFMRDRGNLVLMIYLGSLVVVFPTFVGLWWRSQSNKLQNSINIKTYRLFAEVLGHTGRFRDLICTYGTAFEFERLGSDDPRTYFAPLHEELKRTGRFNLRTARFFLSPIEPYMMQNLLLLSAHLLRLEIPEKLLPHLNRLLEMTESLTTAMADSNAKTMRRDCVRVYRYDLYGNTSRVIQAVVVGQHLIQALDEPDSPLLQVPGFTATEVRFCQSRSNGVKTVYDLAKLSNRERKNILRSFSDEEMLDVNEFCLRYPRATLEVEDPSVDDESDNTVHEFDTAFVDVKLKVARDAGSGFTPCVPRLPVHKEEVWWLILGDYDRDLPLSLKKFNPSDADDDGNFTAKLNFRAPRAGSYEFVVHAICDSYKGCDVFHKFKVRVLPEAAPDENAPKYFDTDDEEEGDLFGMRALDEEDDDQTEESEDDEPEEPEPELSGSAVSAEPASAEPESALQEPSAQSQCCTSCDS